MITQTKKYLGLTVLALSLTMGLSSALPVNAQFEPPGQGKPDDTVGGASRGLDCSQQQCFTLITPTTNGLTTESRPTFKFSVGAKTQAKKVFFSIKEQNGTNFYQTKISIPANSETVSFQLPEDAPALELGKKYEWSAILIGKEGLRPDSPGMKGIINRVTPGTQFTSKLN